VPLDIAIKATRVLNEGIAEYVARQPDRFVGLGSVPLADGNEAAAELERSMRKLGLKGAQVLTNVAGAELSAPQFEPFWKKAEELGALIVLHPNGFAEGQRLTRHYFNNVIGNPFETTLALHYLIFDGVLERHPNLKLLAVHGGGYLGAYSDRIDHAWGARPDCRADLPHPPTHYLKNVFVDSVVFTPQQLNALVEIFGADHVVMGTDYPFDMAESDPPPWSSGFGPIARPKHHIGDCRYERAQTAWALGGLGVCRMTVEQPLHLATAAPSLRSAPLTAAWWLKDPPRQITFSIWNDRKKKIRLFVRAKVQGSNTAEDVRRAVERIVM
jgi:predicted TIM-barrel fold metal-dependent hydrolase